MRIVLALILACAFLSLLVPPLMVDVPPALDFPNHLARLWMVAGGIAERPLASYYAVDWARATVNIGGDLLAASLQGVVEREQIPRVLLILAIMLPPLGAWALHLSIFRRLHWWQLVFPFAGWAMTALVGFLNFQMGVGLALLAAAADGAISRRWWSAALGRAVCAVVILGFHPFAAVFYAGLVAARALGADVRDGLTVDRRMSTAGRVAVALACAIVPIAVVMLLAPNPVHTRSTLSLFSWAPFTIPKKISLLTTGFRSFSPIADVAVAATVFGIPLYAAVRRQISAHHGLLILSFALAAVAAVMPERIGEAYWIDRRLPLMAFLTFMAALRPDILPSGRGVLLAAGALAAITLVRTTGVLRTWTRAQADIASMRQALTHVPNGCFVLPMAHKPSEAEQSRAPVGRYYGRQALFYHYPSMAVLWRHAFVPSLFTISGQQPLRYREPWTALSTPYGAPPTMADLYATKTPRLAYAREWRKFDYILMMNADMPDRSGGRLPIKALEPVADEGFAVLYRILPDPAAPRPRPAGVRCHRAT